MGILLNKVFLFVKKNKLFTAWTTIALPLSFVPIGRTIYLDSFTPNPEPDPPILNHTK